MRKKYVKCAEPAPIDSIRVIEQGDFESLEVIVKEQESSIIDITEELKHIKHKFEILYAVMIAFTILFILGIMR